MTSKILRDGTGCLNSTKVKAFDPFGKPIGLNFSEKNTNYKSWTGSCTSLIIYFIVILVTFQNI